MKRIGIVTICDQSNLGNRLQNYALQYKLKKMGYNVETIKNYHYNIKLPFIFEIKQKFKLISPRRNEKRFRNFYKFDKNNIKYSKYKVNSDGLTDEINNYYDYVIVGSDQVWNPSIGRLKNTDVLYNISPNKKISYAASFSMDMIDSLDNDIINSLKEFKAISVREEKGITIIKKCIDRDDAIVVLDPTMLIEENEWLNIATRPNIYNDEKYILNYFLGDISENKKNMINEFAKNNNCKVINILDKRDPYYYFGPSEFLFLEKNAFCVFTDSFHSCVFAILFKTPFIVFERENTKASMNSRIETLLNKFKLTDRKFSGKIEDKQLKCDYTEAYEILKEERKKADNFLKRALGD